MRSDLMISAGACSANHVTNAAAPASSPKARPRASTLENGRPVPAPNDRCAARTNPASASTARRSSGWATSFARRSASTGVVSLVMRESAESGSRGGAGPDTGAAPGTASDAHATAASATTAATQAERVIGLAISRVVCALPPAPVERMIRAITGACDTAEGESGMVEKRLGSSIGRRDFLRYAGYTGMTVSMAGVLAACKDAETPSGGAQGSGQAEIPPIEQEPGGLQVFDWSGYGNGDYYPKEEKKFLWGQYAKATGDTPEFALFENDDSAYTKVVAGARYDVAHPCGYRYQDWVDLDVMQPWDTSLIPNFSSLNPKLMQAGQFDGQQYFVPLDWGFIAPLVNLDHVDGSDETFNVLFDERYKGKIAWVDTLNMMVVAAYALGIENPWDMTDEELGEVRDFLVSKKSLVRFYWNQSYDFWLAFKKEEVWAGYSWPDTVGYADAAGMNYQYMQPKEGRISWVCGLGLFADTENYRHAHEYVDSWASKEAAEFLLAYYYYGHTNTTANLDVVPEGVRAALGLDDPTVLDEPNAHPESFIPRRSIYQQYWSEVQAA
jgi:spermidine/putrescine transport system substrate-binding protein